MSLVPTTRIERIAYAAGDNVPPCEAVDHANCPPRGLDLAVYRIERIHPDTGEVWRKRLCLGAAAALAKRLGVEFPAIAPADLSEYLESRAGATRSAT